MRLLVIALAAAALLAPTVASAKTRTHFPPGAKKSITTLRKIQERTAERDRKLGFHPQPVTIRAKPAVAPAKPTIVPVKPIPYRVR